MFKVVVLILAVGMIAIPSQAKSKRRVSASDKKVVKLEIWAKGADTVVQIKGSLSEEASTCKAFDVKMNDQLSFNIDCNGKEKTQTLQLESDSSYTVTRRKGHTTVTKYNYLIKKPQISRFKQSTLKVPYVEEIIVLRKGEKGELAFYYESFKVDEFGRIVQDNHIQAHSLTSKKMKISAN